jgi:hypothetical protein
MKWMMFVLLYTTVVIGILIKRMHWPIQYVMNKHSFNIQQCKNKAYNTRAVGVHNLVGRTGKWYSTTNSNTQLYGHYFHNPYFFNLFL